MESKNTAACHCEEDLKTVASAGFSRQGGYDNASYENELRYPLLSSGLIGVYESVLVEDREPNEPIEESSKPENGRTKFVFDGKTHDGWNDTPESIPDVKDFIKNKPQENHVSKSFLQFVAFGTLMISIIPGTVASGRCIGNGGVCLSLAEKGPDWFNKYRECLDVRCLHLSKVQHELLGNFPNVDELYMDDMGNITIPCDVLKNLSNLHKIDLHVKNIFPTDACNTSCVLPEVTVAVLHNTTAIPCNLTEWMPNLKSIRFENDQASTSDPPGIIPEFVTTTAGNMVNQEKHAGIVVVVVIGVIAFGVVLAFCFIKIKIINRVQEVVHLCKMV